MQQNNRQLQVEQIQEETALYEAMLAREKVRHELRTLEQGEPAEPVHSQESSSAVTTDTPAPITGIPRLTEISGVQPQITARIQLPGGRTADVKEGQHIPGTTFRVEKITTDSVVLEQNGIRTTLQP
ncbi:Pilus type IV assembly protein [Escherichia coli]|jgi:type IV pilus biogenesis protein PilP|nr:Pilus type IV assembly protein [Escherichia coli]HBE1834456.1 type IV pilus biogenesis protein PilP [Shigella sonnei]